MRAMRTGTVRFVLEGLSLERLINHCVQHGIMLESVIRPTPKSICATIDSRDYPIIREFAEKQGWKIMAGRITGLPYLKMFAWRRAALVAGVILFLALVWYAGNCVWSIEIKNAGPYEGEVRQVLRANNINIGKFGLTINVEDLRVKLEKRLTGLSWVSVEKDGARLRVYCVQGTHGVEGYRNERGDIIANRDGVIQSVRVAAGTAAVHIGDAVKKGQVLIRGEERGWNNEVRRVTAQGEVLARIWYSAEVIIPNTEIVTVPNGNVYIRRIYITPWLERSHDPPCPFASADLSVGVSRIGAALPIFIREERYEEVRYETRRRDEAELRREASLAAQRAALEEAGVDKRIVDKWVEYSMIDSGIKAIATLEFLEDITVAE